jgi:hypothetical protein
MPIDPSIPLGVRPPQSIDVTRGFEQGARMARLAAISEQERAEMALKQREVAEQEQIRAALQESQGNIEAALPKIRMISPMTALKIEQTYNESSAAKLKLSQNRLAHDLEATEYIARQLNGVTDQQSYDYARAAIAGAGLPVEGMNPRFDPQYIDGLKAKGLSVKEQLELKKAEIDRLFQERKFQAEQQNVKADNERADKAETRQAARDEQQARVEAARLGLERKRVSLAEREAGGSGSGTGGGGDAEMVAAIMANPAIYDGLTPTAKTELAVPLAKAGFKGFAKEAGGKAGPNVGAILSEIETLSTKINTGEGNPMTNVAGMIRRGRAAGNMDNDVAQYQALISGMIPMVARAVGHTGVLTQQDVDSVRAMFPRVGDNKALAAKKMATIKSLIGSVGAAPPPPPGDKSADPLGIRR